MEKIFDEIISDNQDYLNKIRENPKLGKKSKVVYVYSLGNKTIEYPFKDGKIIYIGKAHRNKEATYKRFTQHFQEKGTGSNRSLINFKDSGSKIRLQIFLLDQSENVDEIELLLFQWHIKEYGALPIAFSAGGKNYLKTTIDEAPIQKVQCIVDNL